MSLRPGSRLLKHLRKKGKEKKGGKKKKVNNLEKMEKEFESDMAQYKQCMKTAVDKITGGYYLKDRNDLPYSLQGECTCPCEQDPYKNFGVGDDALSSRYPIQVMTPCGLINAELRSTSIQTKPVCNPDPCSRVKRRCPPGSQPMCEIMTEDDQRFGNVKLRLALKRPEWCADFHRERTRILEEAEKKKFEEQQQMQQQMTAQFMSTPRFLQTTYNQDFSRASIAGGGGRALPPPVPATNPNQMRFSRTLAPGQTMPDQGNNMKVTRLRGGYSEPFPGNNQVRMANNQLDNTAKYNQLRNNLSASQAQNSNQQSNQQSMNPSQGASPYPTTANPSQQMMVIPFQMQGNQFQQSNQLQNKGSANPYEGVKDPFKSFAPTNPLAVVRYADASHINFIGGGKQAGKHITTSKHPLAHRNQQGQPGAPGPVSSGVRPYAPIMSNPILGTNQNAMNAMNAMNQDINQNILIQDFLAGISAAMPILPPDGFMPTKMSRAEQADPRDMQPPRNFEPPSRNDGRARFPYREIYQGFNEELAEVHEGPPCVSDPQPMCMTPDVMLHGRGMQTGCGGKERIVYGRTRKELQSCNRNPDGSLKPRFMCGGECRQSPGRRRGLRTQPVCPTDAMEYCSYDDKNLVEDDDGNIDVLVTQKKRYSPANVMNRVRARNRSNAENNRPRTEETTIRMR